MNKLRKISKKDVQSDEKEIREIFKNYFSHIALFYPTTSELVFNSPAYRANFDVKWGSDSYRRSAWAMVRGDLRDTLPPELFTIFDSHYGPKGTAKAIINEFNLEERYHLCDLIVNSDRSTAEMQEAAKGALNR